MAIYTYNCRDCGVDEDVIRDMRQSQLPYFCDNCGSQMDRQVERPAGFPVGKYGKGNR